MQEKLEKSVFIWWHFKLNPFGFLSASNRIQTKTHPICLFFNYDQVQIFHLKFQEWRTKGCQALTIFHSLFYLSSFSNDSQVFRKNVKNNWCKKIKCLTPLCILQVKYQHSMSSGSRESSKMHWLLSFQKLGHSIVDFLFWLPGLKELGHTLV